MNTKMIIKQAAYRLFETTPFEKVTVQNILDEAEVSRATFYNYFSDKYELVYAYYSEEIAEKSISEFKKSGWESALLMFFDILDKHRRYSKNIAGDPHDANSLTGFMFRFNVDIYRSLRLQKTGKPVLSKLELTTIKAFCTAMMFLCSDYIKNAPGLTKEDYIEIIKNIVPDDYR